MRVFIPSVFGSLEVALQSKNRGRVGREGIHLGDYICASERMMCAL